MNAAELTPAQWAALTMAMREVVLLAQITAAMALVVLGMGVTAVVVLWARSLRKQETEGDQ